ncbi:hypothetical protein B0T21DRAFT_37014 [Apiosordaria backusii]|uniref:Uncharacterized protein n=1 Tax=Apiosordaria backusii TaxID=314023 RepID=A0AA40B2S1_9PEZI|nr:hypothetical protein B0T21DRAFT_37014 [Apiosordaria backusii]
MRRSDTITGKVLDLVEKKMLLADPQERLSSKALVQRLEKLVGVAKYEYSAAVKDDQVPNISQDMLKALLDLDYRVACNTGTDDHRRTTRAMAREQTQRTTRANKTERLDEMIVPAKVAGRQEVLESMLGETIGDRDHLYESPALDGTDHDMPVPEARQLPSPKVPHAKPATSHAIHSDQTVQQQPAVPAFQYSRNRGFDIPSSPPTYSETPVTHGQAAHIPNFFRPVQDPREESNTPSRRGTITAQPPTNPGSSPEPGGTILSTEVPQRRPLLRLPSMRTGQSALSNEAQFDLYPIGELRRRLCSLWERESKGAIFGLLKGKVPQDPRLKDFIKDRDIVSGCLHIASEAVNRQSGFLSLIKSVDIPCG